AFLDYLDRAGVDRAALINYVAPEVIGYTEKANDFVGEYCRADPERLLAVGGLRPDHPDPAREVARLADDLGVRAVKLHPPHQRFRPNAYVDGELPGLRDLYAACARHALPVIFHTGTSVFPGARNRYADPLAIEDVAIDFPELTIVLAHGGRPIWMETAVFLTRRFPNVWLEISGVPPARLLDYFPTSPGSSTRRSSGPTGPDRASGTSGPISTRSGPSVYRPMRRAASWRRTRSASSPAGRPIEILRPSRRGVTPDPPDPVPTDPVPNGR
ncbi:amidohydrolase 2, partial [mine drainage metagenome]